MATKTRPLLAQELGESSRRCPPAHGGLGKSGKPAKPVEKKRKMSREGRARVSAAAKARWAARHPKKGAGKAKAHKRPKA